MAIVSTEIKKNGFFSTKFYLNERIVHVFLKKEDLEKDLNRSKSITELDKETAIWYLENNCTHPDPEHVEVGRIYFSNGVASEEGGSHIFNLPDFMEKNHDDYQSFSELNKRSQDQFNSFFNHLNSIEFSDECMNKFKKCFIDALSEEYHSGIDPVGVFHISLNPSARVILMNRAGAAQIAELPMDKFFVFTCHIFKSLCHAHEECEVSPLSSALLLSNYVEGFSSCMKYAVGKDQIAPENYLKNVMSIDWIDTLLHHDKFGKEKYAATILLNKWATLFMIQEGELPNRMDLLRKCPDEFLLFNENMLSKFYSYSDSSVDLAISQHIERMLEISFSNYHEETHKEDAKIIFEKASKRLLELWSGANISSELKSELIQAISDKSVSSVLNSGDRIESNLMEYSKDSKNIKSRTRI